MAKPVPKKAVDSVKMLAFERLVTTGRTPLEVRAELGMGLRTYYRYLQRFRESQGDAPCPNTSSRRSPSRAS